MSISVAFGEAHEHASMHAQTYTKCFHLGCSVLINGELVNTDSNRNDAHAEVAALASILERGKDRYERRS
jgi:pyrimidine deaminase RibD-like protein